MDQSKTLSNRRYRNFLSFRNLDAAFLQTVMVPGRTLLSLPSPVFATQPMAVGLRKARCQRAVVKARLRA